METAAGAKAGAAGDARSAPEVVEAQLGRPPRGEWAVAVSCPFGFPAVIETAPYLADGTPFPTLYYLTCPSAVDETARREAEGGVELFRKAASTDPALGSVLGALDALVRSRRRVLAERAHDAGTEQAVDRGAVLDRGIGGPRGAARATCLHAYTATLLAAATGALGGEPAEAGGLLGDASRLWCRDARCADHLRGGWERRAALDVGTNSVRLLVALVGPAGESIALVRRAEITQLGEGLSPGRHLGGEAKRRTEAAVARLVGEARSARVGRAVLVGTSAARDAADGREFVAGLGARLGVVARVVSGEEEAALTFLGATQEVGAEAVVIDVGGGSTELVRRDDAASLDLGCVRGTEAWFTSDPPGAEERERARRLARAAFVPFATRFGSARGSSDLAGAPRSGAHPSGEEGPARLIGVAGTATTLACLALALPAYDPDAIHLRTLTRPVLEDVVDRLAALGPGPRSALPCMQPGRAGVIVAGGELLLGAMEALGWDEVTISERDILDGILLSDRAG